MVDAKATLIALTALMETTPKKSDTPIGEVLSTFAELGMRNGWSPDMVVLQILAVTAQDMFEEKGNYRKEFKTMFKNYVKEQMKK